MKTNIFGKITHSLQAKKALKPLVVCLSVIFVISMLAMLATSQAATVSLNGAYWIMPVPADQSTGKVTQTETSTGVSGSIPGDCYGAYPTIADKNGSPYWDLTKTPILSFDIYMNEFWQGDLQDHTGFSVIIVNQANEVWNPSDESACDLSTTYGHTATTGDGSIMRVANSATATHYSVDLRTLGVPLNHISQLIWSVRPGMKGITLNYQISNIQVSAAGGASTPAPTAAPTAAPTIAPLPVTPSPTPSPVVTPAPTVKPTASPTPVPATQAPTPKPTAAPTVPPTQTIAPTAKPAPTTPTVAPTPAPVNHYNWWWNWFSWTHITFG